MNNILRILNILFVVLLIISTMSFLGAYAPWALGAIAGWQISTWYNPLLRKLNSWVDEWTNENE